MVTPREIASEPTYETVKVKAVLIPLGVRFELPEDAKERITISRVRAIDGVRILRFYCIPSAGDILEFKDSRWRVLGLYHEVRPRGSKLVDQMPIVMTDFVSIGSTNA